jgi:hypothetical protein
VRRKIKKKRIGLTSERLSLALLHHHLKNGRDLSYFFHPTCLVQLKVPDHFDRCRIEVPSRLRRKQAHRDQLSKNGTLNSK